MRLITKLTQITTAIVLATGITAVSMQTAEAGPHNRGNAAAAIAGAVIHNAIDNARPHGYRRNYGARPHGYRRNYGARPHGYRRNFGARRYGYRRNFRGRYGYRANRMNRLARRTFRRSFGGGYRNRGFRRGRH